jgi:hypothetical protein
MEAPWVEVKMANETFTPKKCWGYAAATHSETLYLFGGQDYSGRNNDMYAVEANQNPNKKQGMVNKQVWRLVSEPATWLTERSTWLREHSTGFREHSTWLTKHS